MKSLQAAALSHTTLSRPITAANHCAIFKKSRFGYPKLSTMRCGQRSTKPVTLPKLTIQRDE